MLQGSFRHAGVFGDNKWGYKLSGSYFTATDWKYNDPNEPAVFPTITGSARVPDSRCVRDFADKKYSGEFRLDYKPNTDFDNIINAGYSKILSGIDITTAFGAAQAKNWSYTSIQDRIRYKGSSRRCSTTGTTPATAARGTRAARSICGLGFPSSTSRPSRSAQAQQSFELGKAAMVAGDRLHLHAPGARTRPSSAETRGRPISTRRASTCRPRFR